MRILMLNYEYPPLGGGAATANRYMLEEFGTWGKDKLWIDLVTSSAKNSFESKRVGDNIRIFKLDVGKKRVHYWTMAEIARWTKRAYDFSKNLIEKNDYDLAHCWFGWPGGIIGNRFKKRLPYIVALRGSDVPGFNPRLRRMDPLVFKNLSKKIWKNAQQVTVNSKGLEDLAGKTLKRDFKIIPNGVDTSEFKPVSSKRTTGKIRLVSTGRLIERKGYGHLIKALKGMKDFELTLIGEGNLEEELRKQAASLGVEVNFPGMMEHKDLPAALNQADVFILPSLNEGMSNSVLEAMACGLPVIVTDVGGSAELLDGNGFMIKKGSSASIRKVLRKYDRELIEQQGKRSRKLAKGMSWKNICRQYYEVYEESCLG